jgi:hypothetical protein
MTLCSRRTFATADAKSAYSNALMLRINFWSA